MKRHALLYLLSQYQGQAPEEIQYKDQIVHFVLNNTDCFERTLAIGHITASAWLLNHDRTHVLLMHHAQLNRWVQLGGHCDGNPDVLSVAVKEAQEESGIAAIKPVHEHIFDLDVHLIPENDREKVHYHYDIRFLLQVTDNIPFKRNSESKELRWISKSRDCFPDRSVSLMRMYNKWVHL